MKKNDVSMIVHEIALATNNSEQLVADLYTAVAMDMKRDARIMDFVPLLAARRVREDLKARPTAK
ncbi:hypothetical protein NOV72_05403 [Caballeronia novacaledonica]|uniref:DUF3562 domain-containing protein n=1 Tax=Caballeronia novacaledonica TaxID=1544861 RepID=A0A2U3IDA5_9BURK|nr:DUF3562 domain-containing protein [Caballeronia novacaledonica]SPB18204.1 hypothetical protein NOV72_05403 [Caballeronia novacaledonica]